MGTTMVLQTFGVPLWNELFLIYCFSALWKNWQGFLDGQSSRYTQGGHSVTTIKNFLKVAVHFSNSLFHKIMGGQPAAQNVINQRKQKGELKGGRPQSLHHILCEIIINTACIGRNKNGVTSYFAYLLAWICHKKGFVTCMSFRNNVIEILSYLVEYFTNVNTMTALTSHSKDYQLIPIILEIRWKLHWWTC